MRKLTAILLYATFSVCLEAQLPVTLGTEAPRSQTLVIGERQSIASAVLGEEIAYFVKLPEHYRDSSRRYPVLFVMNAGTPSVAANAYATLEMLQSEMLPEMILIGVVNTGRAGAFVPRNANGQPGGADAVVRFIAEELVPSVDARYRTQKYRLLFGQSNAGLFALYAFLTRPEVFDASIAASPTLGWCPDFMLDTARAALAKNRSLHKHLYLNYGGRDYRRLVADAVPAFAGLLQREAPDRLAWRSEVLQADGHVPVASLNNGLLFVFPDFMASDELKARGSEAVDTHFAALSRRYGIELQAPEETLFDLSHTLLQAKKYREAIASFMVLLERYPRSLRARMYLGDAYRDSGDVEKAREAYRRCLEANPAYEQAKQRLNQLSRP